MPTYHERQQLQVLRNELEHLQKKAHFADRNIERIEILVYDMQREADQKPDDERARHCADKAQTALKLVRDLRVLYQERIDLLQAYIEDAQRLARFGL